MLHKILKVRLRATLEHLGSSAQETFQNALNDYIRRLTRAGWKFWKVITVRRKKNSRTVRVFALFVRSFQRDEKRRQRKLGKDERLRLAFPSLKGPVISDAEDEFNEFNPFTAIPGFVPPPGFEPTGYFT